MGPKGAKDIPEKSWFLWIPQSILRAPGIHILQRLGFQPLGFRCSPGPPEGPPGGPLGRLMCPEPPCQSTVHNGFGVPPCLPRGTSAANFCSGRVTFPDPSWDLSTTSGRPLGTSGWPRPGLLRPFGGPFGDISLRHKKPKMARKRVRFGPFGTISKRDLATCISGLFPGPQGPGRPNEGLKWALKVPRQILKNPIFLWLQKLAALEPLGWNRSREGPRKVTEQSQK